MSYIKFIITMFFYSIIMIHNPIYNYSSQSELQLQITIRFQNYNYKYKFYADENN